MTQPQFFKGKIRKEKFFLLLRQHEEEMLPTILGASHLKTNKDARKLAAIALVAADYVGDMDEELANTLLDDIDYHFDKVKCRKIEGMMPRLMGMIESSQLPDPHSTSISGTRISVTRISGQRQPRS